MNLNKFQMILMMIFQMIQRIQMIQIIQCCSVHLFGGEKDDPFIYL